MHQFCGAAALNNSTGLPPPGPSYSVSKAHTWNISVLWTRGKVHVFLCQLGWLPPFFTPVNFSQSPLLGGCATFPLLRPESPLSPSLFLVGIPKPRRGFIPGGGDNLEQEKSLREEFWNPGSSPPFWGAVQYFSRKIWENSEFKTKLEITCSKGVLMIQHERMFFLFYFRMSEFPILWILYLGKPDIRCEFWRIFWNWVPEIFFSLLFFPDCLQVSVKIFFWNFSFVHVFPNGFSCLQLTPPLPVFGRRIN